MLPEDDGAKDRRINNLLKASDKGIHSAKGLLSKLFRIMLFNYNITPTIYERFLTGYLKRHKLPVSERGNFNKAILRDIMTINTFIKSLDFLGITSIKITIEAKRMRDTDITIHTLEVDNIQTLLRSRRTKDDDYN